MATTYDWDAIRAEYIAGSASYKDLAEKYGVSYAQITAKGRENDWAGEREKVRKKALSKTVNMASERQAKAVGNLLDAADKLSKRLINDVDITDNARDVSDISKALKYAADVVAQLYGIQTPAQLHRQKMDEERLALDKQRLEMERKRQEADSTTEPVRIMIVKPEEADKDG